MRNFNDDYGVYVCHHVFAKAAPVSFVVRDYDGEWQFLCGHNDENVSCHLIGVGHLIKDDPTLNEMANLEPGSYAERQALNEKWSVGDLKDIQPSDE